MSGPRDLYDWQGESLEVTWDSRLCIHVGECTRAEGELFKSGRDPWCQPDACGADELAEVIRRCPTGALTYRRTDGGEDETAPDTNVVVVSNNGPLYLTGDLAIEGAASNMPGVRFRAALCRCGHSSSKPFCDNSHEKAGFTDRGPVGQRGDGTDHSGGTLEVKPLADGPLLLAGNVTIVSGGGREAWSGTKAALCRCGESQNKPFCDGTHKDVGFTSG